MKLKIDKKNNATIAIGWKNNRKVKAVCVCHDGDEFDEEFGKELVKEKYKLRKMQGDMRDLKAFKNELLHEIKVVDKEIDELYQRILDKELFIKNMVEERYGQNN